MQATPKVTPAAGQWGAPPERLQQLERGQQELRQQLLSLGRPSEAIDEGGAPEPTVEVGIVSVLQTVNGAGSAAGRRQSRLNYRGDIGLTLPLPGWLEARASAVGQLRFGQGGGIETRPTHTGAVNSTTFEAAAGSDQTYAVVAQAYYQLEVPLDGGRFNDLQGSRIEFSAGKIDLFGMFDQNAVAGDEAGQFLNNVFVHNPLLDSGGDIGADTYGFAPGLRAAWFHEDEGYGLGVSLGVFASGEGSAFGGSLGKPLVIGQFEYAAKQVNGEPRGTYRVYAWTNGRTTDLDGAAQRHSGLGISVDQRFGREWNLFGRLGRRFSGDGNFDSALTVGFEHGGRLWGRGRDAVGLAYGMIKTGGAWRDATADGSLVGYAASGREQLLELYYRFKPNKSLELSPDLQIIRRAGGDGLAPTVRIVGLRANLGF